MDSLNKTYILIINNRKYSLIDIVLILVAILCTQPLFSQQLSENAEDFNVKNYKEELYLRTDRDIYIAGEQVWFKVYKINGLTHAPCDISQVVYLELLDKNNFPQKQLKVKTEGNSGSSGFILPDNLSSGNYIIRAYTSWMQNFTPDKFLYKTISVINPFESIDHLKLPTDNKDVISPITDGHLQSIITDNKGNQLYGRFISNESNKKITYKITLEKSGYKSREQVKINISATDASGNPVESDLSLSVAKSAVVNSTGKTSFYSFNRSNDTISRVVGPEHLAELEGHIISGLIRLKTTDEPLRKIDLSLAYVGKTARCQFCKTNESGEFYFVIKEPGINEIVIQPLSSEISGYYVELNQPFCSTFRTYKPALFYLDSNKIKEINNVIVSMQINNIYEPFRQKKAEESKATIPDFYGQPENTIKMSDYIELTSLREVVKEILPNVYTLKQNGKYDFKLINKFRGQPFENKPLVLVDGVPVFDFEKVLNINSKEIERADVINTRYFYSENVFDGIVSFITKKGNLSAMEFDNSVFRQVYEGCQVKNEFNSPDYTEGLMKDNRIPDFRNTLYWKPDLHTLKDGKAEISFYTSDESAEYTVVVEGISIDGKTGFSTASLTVK